MDQPKIPGKCAAGEGTHIEGASHLWILGIAISIAGRSVSRSAVLRAVHEGDVGTGLLAAAVLRKPHYRQPPLPLPNPARYHRYRLDVLPPCSCASNGGVNLQKLSIMREMGKPHSQQRPYVLQPLWLVGLLGVVFGAIADFGALAFAAQSLLTPVGGFTVVANCWFARICLNERLSRKDAIATVLITIGIIMIATSGDKGDTCYTMEEMVELYGEPSFIGYVIFVVASAAGLFAFHKYANRIKARYGPWSSQYSKLKRLHMISYPVQSGILGAQSILFAKSTAELIKATARGHNQFVFFGFYAILSMLIFTIVSQLHWLAVALKHADALFVIPIFQSFFIIISIVGGGVYFKELDNLTQTNTAVFCAGVMVMMSGIYMLAQRSLGTDEPPRLYFLSLAVQFSVRARRAARWTQAMQWPNRLHLHSCDCDCHWEEVGGKQALRRRSASSKSGSLGAGGGTALGGSKLETILDQDQEDHYDDADNSHQHQPHGSLHHHTGIDEEGVDASGAQFVMNTSAASGGSGGGIRRRHTSTGHADDHGNDDVDNDPNSDSESDEELGGSGQGRRQQRQMGGGSGMMVHSSSGSKERGTSSGAGAIVSSPPHVRRPGVELEMVDVSNVAIGGASVAAMVVPPGTGPGRGDGYGRIKSDGSTTLSSAATAATSGLTSPGQHLPPSGASHHRSQSSGLAMASSNPMASDKQHHHSSVSSGGGNHGPLDHHAGHSRQGDTKQSKGELRTGGGPDGEWPSIPPGPTHDASGRPLPPMCPHCWCRSTPIPVQEQYRKLTAAMPAADALLHSLPSLGMAAVDSGMMDPGGGAASGGTDKGGATTGSAATAGIQAPSEDQDREWQRALAEVASGAGASSAGAGGSGALSSRGRGAGQAGGDHAHAGTAAPQLSPQAGDDGSGGVVGRGLIRGGSHGGSAMSLLDHRTLSSSSSTAGSNAAGGSCAGTSSAQQQLPSSSTSGEAASSTARPSLRTFNTVSTRGMPGGGPGGGGLNTAGATADGPGGGGGQASDRGDRDRAGLPKSGSVGAGLSSAAASSASQQGQPSAALSSLAPYLPASYQGTYFRPDDPLAPAARIYNLRPQAISSSGGDGDYDRDHHHQQHAYDPDDPLGLDQPVTMPGLRDIGDGLARLRSGTATGIRMVGSAMASAIGSVAGAVTGQGSSSSSAAASAAAAAQAASVQQQQAAAASAGQPRGSQSARGSPAADRTASTGGGGSSAAGGSFSLGGAAGQQPQSRSATPTVGIAGASGQFTVGMVPVQGDGGTTPQQASGGLSGILRPVAKAVTAAASLPVTIVSTAAGPIIGAGHAIAGPIVGAVAAAAGGGVDHAHAGFRTLDEEDNDGGGSVGATGTGADHYSRMISPVSVLGSDGGGDGGAGGTPNGTVVPPQIAPAKRLRSVTAGDGGSTGAAAATSSSHQHPHLKHQYPPVAAVSLTSRDGSGGGGGRLDHRESFDSTASDGGHAYGNHGQTASSAARYARSASAERGPASSSSQSSSSIFHRKGSESWLPGSRSSRNGGLQRSSTGGPGAYSEELPGPEQHGQGNQQRPYGGGHGRLERSATSAAASAGGGAAAGPPGRPRGGRGRRRRDPAHMDQPFPPPGAVVVGAGIEAATVLTVAAIKRLLASNQAARQNKEREREQQQQIAAQQSIQMANMAAAGGGSGGTAPRVGGAPPSLSTAAAAQPYSSSSTAGAGVGDLESAGGGMANLVSPARSTMAVASPSPAASVVSAMSPFITSPPQAIHLSAALALARDGEDTHDASVLEEGSLAAMMASSIGGSSVMSSMGGVGARSAPVPSPATPVLTSSSAPPSTPSAPASASPSRKSSATSASGTALAGSSSGGPIPRLAFPPAALSSSAGGASGPGQVGRVRQPAFSPGQQQQSTPSTTGTVAGSGAMR